MTPQWNGIERRTSLRTTAETMVKTFSIAANADTPTELLIHELLVHKIELEMQNEELRRTHAIIEEARDRYVDLYEFAPVSYISINRHGMIDGINLTGAALLGVDRTKLINRRFSTFVAHPDKDRWYRLFMSMMEHAQSDQQKFSLQMMRADGSQFYGHFNCLRKETVDTPPTLRVALVDLTSFEEHKEEIKADAS